MFSRNSFLLPVNCIPFSTIGPKVTLYQLVTTLCFFVIIINSRSELSAAEVTLTASADTGIHESAPDNNMGGNSFVSAGSNGALSPARALFQFDLAGIPSGATIVRVQLRLSVTGLPFSFATDSVFGLHRLNQSWGEGQGIGQLGSPAQKGEATWNARFYPEVLWSAPGGATAADFGSAESSTGLISGLGDYTFPSTPALVADVQSWLDSPESNHGWILISESEGISRTARRFGSRESSSPPQLTVEFTSPLRIDLITSDADGIQIQFTAEPGFNYTVQFKETLESTEWFTLTDFLPQSETTTLVATDSPDGPQRFYRLVRSNP